jgi:hypothetical protein
MDLCEHGNELSGSIKDGKFDQPKDCQLLKGLPLGVTSFLGRTACNIGKE